MDDRQYWLGFNLIKGIGPVRVRELLAHFGTLKEAWYASANLLQSAGLDKRSRRNLIEQRDKLNLKAELARLDKLGIALLTWDDEDYPSSLKQLQAIDQAPPVIYLRGSLSEADGWAIAVVGTRSVSTYGKQVTYQFASKLAGRGLTIISGLARGADAQAHRAALDSGTRTIGILPCGLDMIYPPEHRHMVSEIIQNGAIMSIFPLGTKPVKTNFSARNKIISGLSRGVLITEAGEKSGALLTASSALEQGREVFAIPGNITAHNSAGVNRLIQDGAHPVLALEDILDILNLELATQHVQARQQLPDMSAEERAILRCIEQEALHIDDLVSSSGLDVSIVSSTLITLELKGMVRQVGTMTYVRT